MAFVYKDNLISDGIDVLEDAIQALDRELLDILLIDRTTKKNILWATTDYKTNGVGFQENDAITPDVITGVYATVIQPRITKSKREQSERTRSKAEVFTPSWVCNAQINLIDNQWLGRTGAFNTESGTTWKAVEKPVSFNDEKSWKDYVDAKRIEITCGEAPYLVSRYDTVTGEKIPLNQRIGILDRKMRVVRENASTPEEWLEWSQRAYESVYGYEYQGDNLLLARENLLSSYIEYYYDRFSELPSISQLRRIAGIISWNIWQMDGLKYVVPGSCHTVNDLQISGFGFFDDIESETTQQCPGCESGNILAHTGIYCKIMDWQSKQSFTYVSMVKGCGSQ